MATAAWIDLPALSIPSPLPISGTVGATQVGVWSTGRTWALSFVNDKVDVSGSSVSVSNFPSSSITANITQVASSASNVTLLASNASRKGAVFQNSSAQNCYVKFGATASTASYTIKMEPLSTIIINNDPVYTGIIDGIWDSADGLMAVTELI